AEKQVNMCIQTGSVNVCCQGDREGRPIRINLRASPSTSVGAREDDEGLGGPLWSPASCSSRSHLAATRSPPTPRATIKALPTPRPPPSPLRVAQPPTPPSPLPAPPPPLPPEPPPDFASKPSTPRSHP